MKKILNLLTITILSISLRSGFNDFIDNENHHFNNFNISKSEATVSKIANIHADINTIGFNSKKGLILVGSRDTYPYSHEGIYQSSDKTNFTKNPIRTGMTDIISTKNGITYFADGGHLFKSIDNNTFGVVKSFKDKPTSLGINSDSVIYIGTGHFLYTSLDGSTFNRVHDFGEAYIEKIVFAPNHTIYILLSLEGNEYATKSLDSGYTFNQIPNFKYIDDIIVAPDHSIYVAKKSLYKSIDNGNTFFEVPNSNKDIFHLTIDSNNMLYFGSMYSIWKLNADNTLTEIWSFSETINTVIINSDNILWVGTSHGLYKLWNI